MYLELAVFKIHLLNIDKILFSLSLSQPFVSKRTEETDNFSIRAIIIKALLFPVLIRSFIKVLLVYQERYFHLSLCCFVLPLYTHFYSLTLGHFFLYLTLLIL